MNVWTVDAIKADRVVKVTAPSFIRLFVIQRIIRNSKYETQAQINDLVKVFQHDKQVQPQAYQILLRLVTYGIKNYMAQWYNEGQDINTIEMIFNQIILIKFAKEYTKLITYSCNNFCCNKVRI